MVNTISKCRICGNTNLISIVNLGDQCLTGVFPGSIAQSIPSGPLELVVCESKSGANCGLVQLRHSYEREDLYGENYGYRSSLNNSMVVHLKEIVDRNLEIARPKQNDLIIDIGSNDGTLLGMYPNDLKLAGIDPTIKKFKQFYKGYIETIPDFFSARLVKSLYPHEKAKIVTSIAMFYDLEDPLDFVRQIEEVMDEEGIWVSEQSYLPIMLENNSYDTICHEHVEYYSLKQLKWIFDRCGLKIIDLDINKTNGGSLRVTMAKANSKYKECAAEIEGMLKKEKAMGLDTLKPFEDFRRNIEKHKRELVALLSQINGQNKKVFGYGASTKGNVIIQYCGLTKKDIPYIAEVNEDKFGKFTPFSLIPIISEKEARAMNPDFFMVFPWHFKDNIVKREADFLKSGGKLIMPLPKIEIIGAQST